MWFSYQSRDVISSDNCWFVCVSLLFLTPPNSQTCPAVDFTKDATCCCSQLPSQPTTPNHNRNPGAGGKFCLLWLLLCLCAGAAATPEQDSAITPPGMGHNNTQVSVNPPLPNYFLLVSFKKGKIPAFFHLHAMPERLRLLKRWQKLKQKRKTKKMLGLLYKDWLSTESYALDHFL